MWLDTDRRDDRGLDLILGLVPRSLGTERRAPYLFQRVGRRARNAVQWATNPEGCPRLVVANRRYQRVVEKRLWLCANSSSNAIFPRSAACEREQLRACGQVQSSLEPLREHPAGLKATSPTTRRFVSTWQGRGRHSQARGPERLSGHPGHRSQKDDRSGHRDRPRAGPPSRSPARLQAQASQKGFFA